MNKSLRLAQAAMFTFAMGMGIYIGFLPLHLRTLGADAVALGQFGSFGLLVSCVAYFPAAWLCNRFDRKWLIIAGWGMCIPAPLIIAWAPTWYWAFPSTFLLNISLFSLVALQNYVLRKADPETLSATYASVFAAFSLGSALAQVLGGWLLERTDYFWILVAAALLYLASTLLFLPIESDYPEAAERAAPGLNLRLSGRYWQLLLLFCFIMFTCMLPNQFVVPHLRDRSGLDTFVIGIVIATASLASTVIVPKMGRLADEYNVFWASATILVMVTVAFMTIPLLPQLLPMVILASVLRGSGQSAAIYTAELGRICRPEERSNLLALFGLCSGLFNTVGPMVSGALYDINPDFPFFLAAVLTGALSVALWRKSQSYSRDVA